MSSIDGIKIPSGTNPAAVVIEQEHRDYAKLRPEHIRPPVPQDSIRRSIKRMPPPKMRKPLTDDEVRKILEPRPIRWPTTIVRNMRTNAEPETVMYFRYSTDMQQYSQETQVYQMNCYYQQNSRHLGMPPISAHTFGDPETSGGSRLLERRWGAQMARYLRPGDHMMVAYFDRLGRNTMDILHTMEVLARLRVHIHILDLPWMQYADPGNPDTIRQIQGMAAFAEFERRMTSRRNKNLYDMAISRNIALGCMAPVEFRVKDNPAYQEGVRDGFRNPKYLISTDSHYAAVLEEIYEKWAVDSWSSVEIRAALNFKKIKSRTGGKWSVSQVETIISKEHARRERAVRASRQGLRTN